LGSFHRGTDKYVRPGAKESGRIHTPQERIELGSLDRAQEVGSLMCSLQSIHE
jgi:acetylornithine deacetylase/succinyl-diaminopimelate desuccinylase-like protein